MTVVRFPWLNTADSTHQACATEIARLQARVDELTVENLALRTQFQALTEEVDTLTRQVTQATASRYRAAVARPEGEPPPRKHRTSGNTTRPREAATREVRHEPTVCPDCGRPLLGAATEHRRRQVIDLPDVPYEVVDHLICSRHCGYCARRVLAQPTPEEVGALPDYRIGLRLMATVTDLLITHRLPYDQVQRFLEQRHGLHLAAGELVKIAQHVAGAGLDDLGRIAAEVQAADYAHADETGWRESGRNGYLWQFRSADACYLTFEFTRSASVPRALLDDAFTGVLVSDFYSGYSPLACRKQRCWVHLLRDLKDLAQAHPATTPFYTALRDLYREAQAGRHQPGSALLPEADRIRQRLTYEERALALAAPHAGQADDPARVLAERVQRFIAELFVFVECPAIPSENNPAERTFRPIVIGRKIWGGSRSAKGSLTKTTLLSLFITWQLRGISPLEAIPRLLLGHSTLDAAV
jgi:hypothetical protein